MAIIVYPDEGWNSFVTIQEATDGLTAIGGGDKWAALSAEEQEQMLVKSTVMLTSFYTPSDKCPFAQAQILLLQFDLENDGKYLSFETAPDGEYKKATVGPLSVEYNLGGNDAGMGGGSSGLPPMIDSLLNDCKKSGDNRVEGFKLVF